MGASDDCFLEWVDIVFSDNHGLDCMNEVVGSVDVGLLVDFNQELQVENDGSVDVGLEVDLNQELQVENDDDYDIWCEHVLMNLRMYGIRSARMVNGPKLEKMISAEEHRRNILNIPKAFVRDFEGLEIGYIVLVVVEEEENERQFNCMIGKRGRGRGFTLTDGIKDLYVQYEVSVGDTVCLARFSDEPHHFDVTIKKTA